MKKIMVLLFLLSCVCLAANAQQQPTNTPKDHPIIAEREQNACSGDHKPGDHLKCYIVFDGDPELQSISLVFQLLGAPAENQIGLQQGYGLNQLRKIGPGEYALEGQVPDCARGNYRLNVLYVQMRGVQRGYSYGAEYKDLIQVQVINDVDLHFPKIKDISAEPPKEEKAAAVPVKK